MNILFISSTHGHRASVFQSLFRHRYPEYAVCISLTRPDAEIKLVAFDRKHLADNKDAIYELTPDILGWADLVVAMDAPQAKACIALKEDANVVVLGFAEGFPEEEIQMRAMLYEGKILDALASQIWDKARINFPLN